MQSMSSQRDNKASPMHKLHSIHDANSISRTSLNVRAWSQSWSTHAYLKIPKFSLLLIIILLSPSFAQAQQAETATVVSVQELEALATAIEDKAARVKLLSSIRALAEVKKSARKKQPVESAGARLIADLSTSIRHVSRQMLAATETLSNIPALVASIQKGMTDSNTRQLWLGFIFKVVLILTAAGISEYVMRFLLNRPKRILEERAADTFWVRLSLLGGRTVLDIVPLAAFATVAFVVVPFMQPTTQVQIMALTIINAYLIVCSILVLARMGLAPAVESLRVLPLTNMCANYLFIWTRRLTSFSVFGFFFAEAALLLGMSASGHAALLRLLGLIVTGLVVVFISQNRVPVATWIRGAGKMLQVGGLRNRFADIWHVLASIYAVAIFAVWALGMTGGFEYLARASAFTAVILIAVRLTSTGLDSAVDKGFTIREDLRKKFPTLEERANRYLPTLRLVLRWVVNIIAALVVLEAWGVDAAAWLETPLGRQMSESAFNILAVIILALIFWEAVNSSVENYLIKSDAEGNAIKRSPRVRTLLPLLRKVIFTVLAVMVTLMVLAELGIKIGPLLAGAGVIGLAIGFGAQTLVKDVITGLFILIEDTIAIGDYVQVGTHEGDVESLSIRTLRLRDPAGTVHTVPFSEVGTVLNFTKDYSNVVLNIGISYRENVDEVIKVLEKLGQEMADDPVLGRDIITPLFVQGLQSLDESAVVIRARIKVKPGTQWGLKREFNRLMKNRFDELGIEIPFPQRTITFASDTEKQPVGRQETTENILPDQPQVSDGKTRIVRGRGDISGETDGPDNG
jgi:small-conductance mechanosensitive channel